MNKCKIKLDAAKSRFEDIIFNGIYTADLVDTITNYYCTNTTILVGTDRVKATVFSYKDGDEFYCNVELIEWDSIDEDIGSCYYFQINGKYFYDKITEGLFD
jgi:hypothetical protein